MSKFQNWVNFGSNWHQLPYFILQFPQQKSSLLSKNLIIATTFSIGYNIRIQKRIVFVETIWENTSFNLNIRNWNKTYLSLFFVRRLRSTLSIRFLNHVAILVCFVAGWDWIIWNNGIVKVIFIQTTLFRLMYFLYQFGCQNFDDSRLLLRYITKFYTQIVVKSF